MTIKPIGKIASGQDGAIWGRYLFRFNAAGDCRVYDLNTAGAAGEPLPELAAFTLDRADVLKPHSNAVMFGCEYAHPTDEFPLLYTNIYNNYAGTDTPLKGVCCVYRLWREGETFRTQLVQLIEIGFVEDARWWHSSQEKNDARPYGNFAIDREHGTYYAFTMRDHCRSTRYFAFPLPKLADGVPDATYGVRRVTLTVEDMLDYFDCDYHRYLQGACAHSGRIYSVEGFTDSESAPPAMRVISPAEKRQEQCVLFGDHGLTVEPELIDFWGDTCIYADNHGNLYEIAF